jgi:hypothetical protein
MTETRIVGVVLFLFIHLWFWGVNNGLKIMKTFICKIPPNLPLPSGSETALGRRPKGGIIPLFGRRPIGPLARRVKRGSPRGVENPTPQGEGRFSNDYVNSILRPFIFTLCPMLYALCVFSFKTDLHNKVSARSVEGNG